MTMGPFQDNLPPCLLEWQRLTGTEAIAIEAGDWDELAQLQTAKSNLKSRMESLDFSHPDPKWIADIIAEEGQNRDLLQEKLDDLQLQLSEECRSMNNIQRVHRAYGHQPLNERQPQPIWHQIS